MLLWYFGLLHDHFWENGYYQMKFSCWNSYNSACQIFLQAWRHALSGRLASKNIVGENTQDHLTNVGITFAQYKVGKNFINNPCQCFGSGLIDSGSEILGWIRIRIQRFDDQKLKKIYSWKKIDIPNLDPLIWLNSDPIRIPTRLSFLAWRFWSGESLWSECSCILS
jgi:hypothetical protein